MSSIALIWIQHYMSYTTTRDMFHSTFGKVHRCASCWRRLLPDRQTAKVAGQFVEFLQLEFFLLVVSERVNGLVSK